MERHTLKGLFAILSGLVLCWNTGASPLSRTDTLALREYTDEYLDTVKLERKFIINDYSTFGVEYGASLSRMFFNPSQDQAMLFAPKTAGVYYIRYGKMFGYLPYFGFKTGIRYSHEGYKFKENKETGRTATLEGATQAIFDFVDVPFMAHFHMDLLHFAMMADIGIYGGYRLGVERTGPYVKSDVATSFLDTDRRFDYGLAGGVGFAVVFDPFELHVNGSVRYGWGNLYDPDYASKYYYRYANAFDIMVTAGLYIQLGRRTGRNRSALRREAIRRVNSELENGTFGSESW